MVQPVGSFIGESRFMGVISPYGLHLNCLWSDT
jgi:hypothetical protein